MKHYEIGDKVVVEIKGMRDIDSISNVASYAILKDYNMFGDDLVISDEAILGKVEDFTPKPEKIRMTVEEKKEFDDLCSIKSRLDIGEIMSTIIPRKYDTLNKRLYYQELQNGNIKKQIEFVKALEHPELIEVEHEFKIGNSVIVDTDDFKALGIIVGTGVCKCFKVLFKSGLVSSVFYKKMKLVKENAIDWEDQNGERQKEEA
ncbi:hypothetical protein [Liquorilactobacillus mali]|uniref:Uncharacterized protein n=1 Tax=Liquorilactobacillus mali KCTC 3596 = DSM 20444 TaxID=1046596 RepID=A0A0R2EBM8_9LACO|nr:hypothetical protein [Liquorilactobacillus mali]KRN09348.1 hypothetical protein FD00_GL001070 [Liquorilactobacillus mali KCTC 3596 = DSM 20444]